MNKPLPTFLFVCGVGRSGTTVLRTSLGTHPQIYYNGFENNIVQDIAEVALKNCTAKSRKNAMAVEQEEYDEHFRTLIRSLMWPDTTLASRPIHMAAINPTPAQLDYLVQLFPDSKFVGLIRNGIEVVSSRTEYRSFAANDFASHCETWNRAVKVLEWGRRYPDCFREIRQEWFYAPEQLHRWIAEFSSWLSIELSDEPTKSILGTLRHPTSAEFSIDRRAFRKTAIEDKQKYFRSKRDRWQEWTDKQRAIFKELCSRNMGLTGYEIPWNSSAN